MKKLTFLMMILAVPLHSLIILRQGMVRGTKELFRRKTANSGQRADFVDKPSTNTLINNGPVQPVVVEIEHPVDLAGCIAGGG